MQQINVYGADNCSDTGHTREHLQTIGVPHRYYNIEEDSMAEARVRALNGGMRRTPTVIIFGDDVEEYLSAPTDAELDAAIQRHQSQHAV
jgi:glutaredoxin